MSVVQFQLSAEQAAVYETIEGTREHIFVTGRAGTGKSTLLNHLSWNTSKQVVICAPTGVAALNVGGPDESIRCSDCRSASSPARRSNRTVELRKLLNTIDTARHR